MILSDRSLVARIAASSVEATTSIQDQLKAALPEAVGDELEVPVRFWWWQSSFAQDMARMLPVPTWSDVRDNYVGEAAEKIDTMASWEQPPAGGRLVLWHGAPGTGKTSALRALAGEWRDWAEFQFITDPEEFLRKPSYLLSTLTTTSTRGAGLPGPPIAGRSSCLRTPASS